MTDPWGIGESLRTAMRMYSHAKRATGRTELLLSALRDGDTVVTATRHEAQQLKSEASRRGIDIDVITYEPSSESLQCHHDKIMEKWNHRNGRLFFDHTWYEAFYFYQIENWMRGLEELTKNLKVKEPLSDEERRLEHLNAVARAAGAGEWEGEI